MRVAGSYFSEEQESQLKADSGFRSADGIYHQKYKYSPEQVVSHSFFIKYPEAFYEFYKEKMMMLDAKPNPAHLKLAELEAAGKLQAVVTQNIDGLHQAAGSKKYMNFMEVSIEIIV